MSGLSDRAEAQWFGTDGRALSAEVSFVDGEVRAENIEGENRAVPLSAVVVSPRLANIPRRIELPDGVALSVADNDFVDSALRRAGRGRASGWLHQMESKVVWGVVLLAVATFSVWLVAERGFPLIGEVVAAHLSAETLRDLSDEARETLLARDVFQESRLSGLEKERARKLFAALTAQTGDAESYHLRFYRMEFRGREYPNAFALPDGTIVLTDRLAELADDGELTAVMAHEIGHAKERHGARMLVHAVGAAALGALIFGDITGALGAALLSAGHSRELEREADCFAYALLAESGANWEKLGGILRKMERDIENKSVAKSSADSDSDSELGESELDVILEEGLEKVLDFLSTHPPTEARANPQEHCK